MSVSQGHSTETVEGPPLFEAFRAIVSVHCEISDLVVCWLPTANSTIVSHLTYGPWCSNGAKETSAYSIRKSHQSIHKAMIYCGVIILPPFAVKWSYAEGCVRT
jgi:hypothetical protein